MKHNEIAPADDMPGYDITVDGKPVNNDDYNHSLVMFSFVDAWYTKSMEWILEGVNHEDVEEKNNNFKAKFKYLDEDDVYMLVEHHDIAKFFWFANKQREDKCDEMFNPGDIYNIYYKAWEEVGEIPLVVPFLGIREPQNYSQ